MYMTCRYWGGSSISFAVRVAVGREFCSLCLDGCCWLGRSAPCAVEGWLGACDGGVENIFILLASWKKMCGAGWAVDLLLCPYINYQLLCTD